MQGCAFTQGALELGCARYHLPYGKPARLVQVDLRKSTFRENCDALAGKSRSPEAEFKVVGFDMPFFSSSNGKPVVPSVPMSAMDRQLLDGFRNGRPDALAQLYETHVKDVFIVASQGFVLRRESTTRVPGLQDAASQQDVVQDTFIRAFSATARKNYSGTTPFRAYLLQICRNLMIDRARKYKREVMLEDLVPAGQEGIDIESVIRSGDSPEPPALDLDQKRREEAVREFLSGLDDELKAIYEKRFVDGMSERDTAESLGITRRKTRTRHEHLVEQLRDFLTEKGMWPPDDL